MLFADQLSREVPESASWLGEGKDACLIIQFLSVSCSTVTVTKCQAALRTLQGFPYFSPTCLCQEPHRDPECNQIREYLFDHPCGIVKTKGTSPFRPHYWIGRDKFSHF